MKKFISITGTKNRTKLLAINGASALTSRVVGLFVNMMVVPLTIGIVGPKEYGVWAAVMAVVAMLGFSDFGLGNGLLSKVASSQATAQDKYLSVCLSSNIAAQATIAILFIAGYLIATKILGLNLLPKNLTENEYDRAKMAMDIAVVVYFFGMPIAAVYKFQTALQKSFIVHGWQIISSIFLLIIVYLQTKIGGGLIEIVVAMTVVPIFFSLLNAVTFFLKNKEYAPSVSNIKINEVASSFKVGGAFFILQIIYIISFSADVFIISKLVGPEMAATYAVCEKLFMLISTSISMAVAPLWPAYANARNLGDIKWMKNIYFRVQILSLVVATLASLLIVCFMDEIIGLWIGGQLTIPFVLAASFGVWKIVESVGQNISVYLNSAGRMKFQLRTGIICGILVLISKVNLIEREFINYLPAATALLYLAIIIIPFYFVKSSIDKDINCTKAPVNQKDVP